MTFHDSLSEVATFMKTFEQPVSQGWNKDVIGLGMKLIDEEHKELKEVTHQVLDEININELGLDTVEHFVKELGDLAFVVYWMAAGIGLDLTKVLTKIYESNMSKLGEDDKPIFREDGKVLKGPHYTPPDFSEVARNVPVYL